MSNTRIPGPPTPVTSEIVPRGAWEGLNTVMFRYRVALYTENSLDLKSPYPGGETSRPPGLENLDEITVLFSVPVRYPTS